MQINVAGRDAYAYTGCRSFDPQRSTIVFAHGAANDHGVWVLQSRYFAHHGHNVLAIDWPGHGRSAGEPLASVPSLINRQVGLHYTLGVERVGLVPHTMWALAL